MRRFNRGATIPFTHTFYDSTGGITSPSSARLTVSFPSSGWPYRGVMETTYVTLTQNTSTHASAPLAWTGNLPTTQMHAGPVFYMIASDDVTLAVEDGQFDLKANPANVSVTTL